MKSATTTDNTSLESWFQHRVSYGETDCMGVVYYAEYFHMYERARSEYIRNLGMSYTEVESRGLFLPVREAQCRYRSPATFDALLHIRTRIIEIGRASLTFAYEIFDEEKKTRMTEGMTQHACVSKEGKPIRVPEWFRALIEQKKSNKRDAL